MAIAEDRQGVARKGEVSGIGGGLAATLKRRIGATWQIAMKTPGHGSNCAGKLPHLADSDRSCLVLPEVDDISEHFIGDDFLRTLSSAAPKARQESSAADVYNLEDSAWHIPARRI